MMSAYACINKTAILRMKEKHSPIVNQLFRFTRMGVVPYILYFIFTVDIAWSISGFLGWLGILILQVIIYMIVHDYLFLGLIRTSRAWYTAIRLNGFSSISAGWHVYSLDKMTLLRGKDRTMFLGFFLLGLVLFLLWMVWQSNYFLFFSITFIWLIVSFSLNSAIPPTILFLSTSNRSSLYIQGKIMDEVPWVRVISLLYVGENAQDVSREISADIFRTKDSDVWRAVFKKLATLVPILVVDTRSLSTELDYEMNWIQSTNTTYKCLFLVDENHNQPLITSSIVRLPAHIINESQLFNVIKQMTRSANNMPRFERDSA